MLDWSTSVATVWLEIALVLTVLAGVQWECAAVISFFQLRCFCVPHIVSEWKEKSKIKHSARTFGAWSHCYMTKNTSVTTITIRAVEQLRLQPAPSWQLCHPKAAAIIRASQESVKAAASERLLVISLNARSPCSHQGTVTLTPFISTAHV